MELTIYSITYEEPTKYVLFTEFAHEADLTYWGDVDFMISIRQWVFCLRPPPPHQHTHLSLHGLDKREKCFLNFNKSGNTGSPQMMILIYNLLQITRRIPIYYVKLEILSPFLFWYVNAVKTWCITFFAKKWNKFVEINYYANLLPIKSRLSDSCKCRLIRSLSHQN